MKRRTMLQSLLAVFGLASVASSQTDNVIAPEPSLSLDMTHEFVKRSVEWSLAAMTKPAGDWRISVSGVMNQPDVCIVYVDYFNMNTKEALTANFTVAHFDFWRSLRTHRDKAIGIAVRYVLGNMATPNLYCNGDKPMLHVYGECAGLVVKEC